MTTLLFRKNFPCSTPVPTTPSPPTPAASSRPPLPSRHGTYLRAWTTPPGGGTGGDPRGADPDSPSETPTTPRHQTGTRVPGTLPVGWSLRCLPSLRPTSPRPPPRSSLGVSPSVPPVGPSRRPGVGSVRPVLCRRLLALSLIPRPSDRHPLPSETFSPCVSSFFLCTISPLPASLFTPQVSRDSTSEVFDHPQSLLRGK